MTVYSWEQINDFALGRRSVPALFSSGTALSVGSFDGPHIGHRILLDTVLSEKNLTPGLVTFTKPLGRLKRTTSYKGDISTLRQRLEISSLQGFAFVVVIDFSPDFGRIEGRDFLSILVKGCNMKFIAEGRDFRCGYRGAVGMDEILVFAREFGIRAVFPAPVMYMGRRISSSLIREYILKGDFIAAEKLLNHRYGLDCSLFRWSEEQRAGKKFFFTVPSKTVTQILPPGGSYTVMLILSEDRLEKTVPGDAVVHTRTCQSQLFVEPEILRLEVLQKTDAEMVRTIEFVSG